MGELAKARKELETAVQLRPTLSPALYQLGQVYHKLGEEERSREALEKFQKLTQEEKTGSEDPIDVNLED
jgi:Flp pilus assembly protein TadD